MLTYRKVLQLKGHKSAGMRARHRAYCECGWSSEVREALEAIITKQRPCASFNISFQGVPLVNQGETVFMTVKKARRLIDEIYAELNALLATIPAEGCDSAAADQSSSETNHV